MKTFIRRAAKLTAALILLIIALPFLLVATDWPKRELVASGETLDLRHTDLGTPSVARETWIAPDGSALTVRRYPSENPSAPLVVMIHGSGLHSGQFDHLATALSSEGTANVLVPDLRGHGPSPERRGDVDHVGQLEDDLAALIQTNAAPDQEVVLLGHSSGGGLVVRFAGGEHGAMLDRAILLAPYLGHDAPTTRPNAGGWAHPLIRRYIGLEILNGFGFARLNGLTVVQFNLPPGRNLDAKAGEMTTHYSYRLNTSYHPRPNLGEDISHLPNALLIAGTDDEAFVAEAYQPTMEAFTTRGTYHLLPGLQHMDVVNAPKTIELITNWLLSE